MRRPMALVLAALLVAAVSLQASGAAKKGRNTKKAHDYQVKLGSVRTRIKAVKHKLAVTKHKQRVVTSQLYSTQRRLHDTRDSLRTTRARLGTARGQLVGIHSSLKRAEAQLLEKRIALTHRLADAYKHPAPTYILAAVTSHDAWSAMTRTKMIQEVVDSDLQLLQDIRETRAEIVRQQKAQRRKVTEINGLQSDLASKETDEKSLAWQQQDQLKSIVADRQEYERALDELLEESRHITDLIQQLQRTPAGRRRLAIAFHGGFIHPVNGPVTSPFGMRFHPILKKWKLHTGIDFGVPIGTPVHAAAAGTVILAGWMRAYGNAVVIDHGGGVSTLYGHCSQLLVRVGEEVRQDQVIARSGNTGWSTGPHLHFEVRHNGHPVRPF